MSIRPKRRMESFKLAEISSVDVPAQEGARAAIMKSRSALTFKEALQKLADQTKEHLVSIEKKEEAAEEITEEQFETTLASVAKALRQIYRCPPHDAMQGARRFLTNPGTFEKLAPRVIPALKEDVRKSQSQFARKVLVTVNEINEFQKKHGTPLRKTTRQDALRRLRLENPEEFEAYQRR